MIIGCAFLSYLRKGTIKAEKILEIIEQKFPEIKGYSEINITTDYRVPNLLKVNLTFTLKIPKDEDGEESK